MGKDKYENEELIKYAWPDLDVWFHVADLSSAHVYLNFGANLCGEVVEPIIHQFLEPYFQSQ